MNAPHQVDHQWTTSESQGVRRTLGWARLVVALVPWAAYGLPRDVLDRVFAESGLGFKLVHLATRRRFAIREARAFRYV